MPSHSLKHRNPAARRYFRTGPGARRGAVLPLFALMLPVLLILAGIAVNVSYMQLTRTELKVATDAAARAAGRAFSEYQSVDQALAYAQSTAQANRVAGQPLSLNTTDDTGDIRFGQSSRTGSSRYTFTARSTSSVRSLAQTASAVQITGRRNNGSSSGTVSLPFRLFGSASTFQPTLTSICTQVDRDIALILDRSGSMAESMYRWSDFYEDVQRQETYWSWGGWRTRTVTVREWDPPEMEDRMETFEDQYEDWE
ncbi:MAG TPA: pilus assembly protein TadG-related protein, partial [Pirellulaceae bacterium]